MNEMYSLIDELCKAHGINMTQMCKEAGIPRGNLTDLKMGRTAALATKSLAKISAYFNVSIDYLLGTEQKENAPALTEKDRRDAAKDVERIMGDLENSGELMFDGVPISPEARESLAAAMKLGLEAARLKNKETYTPKKYRR